MDNRCLPLVAVRLITPTLLMWLCFLGVFLQLPLAPSWCFFYSIKFFKFLSCQKSRAAPLKTGAWMKTHFIAPIMINKCSVWQHTIWDNITCVETGASHRKWHVRMEVCDLEHRLCTSRRMDKHKVDILYVKYFCMLNLTNLACSLTLSMVITQLAVWEDFLALCTCDCVVHPSCNRS